MAPARAWHHVLVFALPALLATLAVVQGSRDDGRYSLAPFQYVIFFQPQYYRELDDDRLQYYSPQGELRDYGLKKLRPDRLARCWFYNRGSLERTVREYLAFLHDTHGGPFVARVDYRVGREGALRRMTLRHPVVEP